MARTRNRKTLRDRSSGTDRSSGGQTDQPERIRFAARPRRPSRSLLIFSVALFLTWLIMLMLLTFWQA
jgi:hypothetical protein